MHREHKGGRCGDGGHKLSSSTMPLDAMRTRRLSFHLLLRHAARGGSLAVIATILCTITQEDSLQGHTGGGARVRRMA
jgi:hypothetical protein